MDFPQGVLRAAVGKIAGQDLLADVARNAQEDDVRKAAVKKLTDQALLVEIARTDPDEYVRMAAKARIKDPAQVARSAPYVDEAAVRAVTDQALLADVAVRSPELPVSFAALERLATLAEQDHPGPPGVQKTIVDLATNRNRLMSLRVAAVRTLTDRARLAECATSDVDPVPRYAAQERLGTTDDGLRTALGERVASMLESFDEQLWKPGYPLNAGAFGREPEVVGEIDELCAMHRAGFRPASEALGRVVFFVDQCASNYLLLARIAQPHNDDRRLKLGEWIRARIAFQCRVEELPRGA